MSLYCTTMKPPIKDTPEEDKLPNKGHTKCTHSVHNNLQKRTTSLQRTNGWVPMVSTIRRFHCISELPPGILDVTLHCFQGDQVDRWVHVGLVILDFLGVLGVPIFLQIHGGPKIINTSHNYRYYRSQ